MEKTNELIEGTSTPSPEASTPPRERIDALPTWEDEKANRPRVYVADLGAYVAGYLHGTWINAAADLDDIREAIGVILATSPATRETGIPSEEYAIHDFEGFHGLRLGESESLETVGAIARGIERFGPAFAAWADHVGIEDAARDMTERDGQGFEEAFLGQYDSPTAFAEDHLDQSGILDELRNATPEPLRYYLDFDYAMLARDMQLGGDVHFEKTDSCGVWAFQNA